MPILSSLSVLGAHFSASAPAGNWYDDSSNAHHTVTLNGSVTQSDEGGGVKAALFDGSTGYLRSNLGVDIGTDDFTLEAFIKPTSSGNYPQILGLGNFVDGILWRAFADNNQEVVVQNAQVFQDQGVSLDAWNHVALTRTGGASADVNVFVNGLLKYAVPAAGNGNLITSDAWIGYADPAWIGSQGPYQGKMAAVRIIKGTALYTSNFSVPTTLPTAVSGTQLLLSFGATAVPTV